MLSVRLWARDPAERKMRTAPWRHPGQTQGCLGWRSWKDVRASTWAFGPRGCQPATLLVTLTFVVTPGVRKRYSLLTPLARSLDWG
jgi:hypothetical protein